MSANLLPDWAIAGATPSPGSSTASRTRDDSAGSPAHAARGSTVGPASTNPASLSRASGGDGEGGGAPSGAGAVDRVAGVPTGGDLAAVHQRPASPAPSARTCPPPAHNDPACWSEVADVKRPGWLRTTCVKCGVWIGSRPAENGKKAKSSSEAML